MCEICKGAGWLRINVPFGHPQFGKPVQCECRRQEIQLRSVSRTYTWLGNDGEQARELESLSFATFRSKANGQSVAMACKQANDYALQVKCAPKGQKNLLFLGPYGVGKTHLACATLNEVRSNGVGCLFVAGNQLFQAIYSSGFDESILRKAIETPLLCFDDLDKLQIKDDGSFQKTTLFTLFNERYLAKRPTIITANAVSDWEQWLHGAVISRLLGGSVVVHMTGQDYRRVRVGLAMGVA